MFVDIANKTKQNAKQSEAKAKAEAEAEASKATQPMQSRAKQSNASNEM